MNPTQESALCLLSATEALRLFRSRELSPVELLEAQIARARRIDGAINALCETRFEQAMVQARLAEKTYAANPSGARPLEGLPTLLKNEHTMIGLHTTAGSWLCDDGPDTVDAPLVERLLSAGAVIHGQTQVPEFYLAGFTRSARYGVTRNPWNPSVTCGGSSGGSAAALAAGLTTLATASDIGGSARIPAAYCGVVGFKPSYGRIPESSFPYAINFCNHNAVMARSVADCALMFNVVAGPHAADPATVKPKVVLPTAYPSVAGMRIAVSHDLGYFRIGDDVRRNTARVADALRAAGASVDEVALAWDRPTVTDAFTHYLGFQLGIPLADRIRDHRDVVSDYVANFADLAQGISSRMFCDAPEAIGRMHAALQDVFARYDAMVCPTVAVTDTPAEGMADAHDNLLDTALTYPFNLLSRHPVLALPSGLAGNGVPTGVQIVGPTFDEHTVMRIGAAIERHCPWPYPDV